MYSWNSLWVEVQFITSSFLSSTDGYTVWCEHFSVEQSVFIIRPFCRQYNCHGLRFTQSLPMVERSSDYGLTVQELETSALHYRCALSSTGHMHNQKDPFVSG
jgi:hypothetical protein